MPFFLSQLIAKHHELGFDPTMKLLLPVQGQPVYDITVQVSEMESLVYRTKELVNQDNAAVIRGRGTRVWYVVLLKNGAEVPEETGVLKDSWVDPNRQREGAILEQIRNTEVAEEEKADFDSSFLTVIAHGDVLINGSVENTRSLMTSGAIPPSNSHLDLRIPGQSLPMVPDSHTPVANSSDVQSAIMPPPNYGPGGCDAKSRYRIVFAQKCRPLSKVTSLADAFRYLSNAVIGESC